MSRHLVHRCSICGSAFAIASSTRVGLNVTLNEDFQRVKCPVCGNVEVDERILIFGLFQPRVYVYMLLGIAFAVVLWQIIEWLPGFF
jgi:hypothetical protein